MKPLKIVRSFVLWCRSANEISPVSVREKPSNGERDDLQKCERKNSQVIDLAEDLPTLFFPNIILVLEERPDASNRA